MPPPERTRTLVLDAAPLLASSLASLRAFSSQFVTTQHVLDEVREKGQRQRLDQELRNLQASLAPADKANSPAQPHPLQIREPSVVGLAKIKEFARKTGDIAVLSPVDIGVLAVAYDVEVEANGTLRLRENVGGTSLGKDPDKKKTRLSRRQQTVPSGSAETGTPQAGPSQVDTESLVHLCSFTHALALNPISAPPPGDSPTSKTELPAAPELAPEPTEMVDPCPAQAEPPCTPTDADWKQVSIRPFESLETLPNDCSETSSVESESDPSWISPANLHIHQARDLGGFTTLTLQSGTGARDSCNAQVDSKAARESVAGAADGDPIHEPTMKVALLTGDFAMQNVALQIGLNVLGAGGRRIRDLKTWVLRCYGCFKLCKDPTRKFCPKCGGPTLTRVSITYTPSSPTGYILHLKKNFQYHNRGSVYSIPSPKPGSASFEKGASRQKGINGASLVLREDQKEFQRGLQSLKIQKFKQERSLIKAQKENSNTNRRFNALNGGTWNNPDWEAPMMLGEKGRRGVGRHNPFQPCRIDRNGLPIIGFGKNPNVARRRR